MKMEENLWPPEDEKYYKKRLPSDLVFFTQHNIYLKFDQAIQNIITKIR